MDSPGGAAALIQAGVQGEFAAWLADSQTRLQS